MIRKGYTLIELLVVITISIIIFSVGIAGYREFSRRQSLTGVLNQVKADLRSAQQLALTGQKPEGVTCTKLVGYTFTRTDTGYQIFASCSDGITITNTIIKDVEVLTGVTISAGSVTFKVLGQGTYLSSPLTFTIASSNSGTSAQVTIGVGGDIK